MSSRAPSHSSYSRLHEYSAPLSVKSPGRPTVKFGFVYSIFSLLGNGCGWTVFTSIYMTWIYIACTWSTSRITWLKSGCPSRGFRSYLTLYQVHPSRIDSGHLCSYYIQSNYRNEIVVGDYTRPLALGLLIYQRYLNLYTPCHVPVIRSSVSFTEPSFLQPSSAQVGYTHQVRPASNASSSS